MRSSRRVSIGVIRDSRSHLGIREISEKYGLAVSTVRRLVGQYRRLSLRQVEMSLRFTHLDRLPSIESQALEWIDLMVADQVAGGEQRLPHSRWLEWHGMKVYLRWCPKRLIDGKPRLSLDVASIRIPEKYRGRGWFREFVKLLTMTCPTDGIFIEAINDVRNPWMRGTLLSWGFREVGARDFWRDLNSAARAHANSRPNADFGNEPRAHLLRRSYDPGNSQP